MSQARVYTTKGPVRKDFKCGSCGAEIKKGVDRRRTFAVGFRGFEQTRCMKSECTPTRSQLESSAVASVYDAMDSVDLESCTSLEELQEQVQNVVDALNEVADEYSSNEMFEINEDLQERASTLENSASELESWDSSLPDMPEDDDEFEDGEREDYEAELDEWLTQARDAAQSAIDDVELP
jgi:seryl-tRNA synthetase